MAHKLFSLVLMLVLELPVVIFAFAGDENKSPMPAEIMQKQIADAIKVYGEKKEIYRKDVLSLFERKEKNARDKGDLKTLNLIKKEWEIFSEDAKEPTLFLITDQKRFLELAKLDLIKAYEKTIKDCLKMKLDVEAEGFSKELEQIRAGKIKDEEKVEVMKAKPIFLEAPFSAEAAKTAQMELAKSLNKPMEAMIDLGKGVKLEMMLIPAGKFMMGSPVSEKGRKDNETQHEVTLTKPYYMGKYEVTQEQWEVVMGNNPSETKGLNYPVTNISWNDGQDYLRKLNAKVNGDYRLPTEAEWEYACRAGTTTTYSFGDAITIKDANYGSGSKSVAVGSYKPNPFGLYDMHGNVWEWCEDWLGAYSKELVIDPQGPETGKSRVLRGGFSFLDFESIVRSSYRSNDLLPNGRYGYNGFRLARTADFKVSVGLPVPKSDPPEVMPRVGDLLIAPFTEAKAKKVQKSVAKSLHKEVYEKEDLGKGIKLEMVLIPAGKFMMGSPASEVGRVDNETQHEVTLTKPFYMGNYEVTQEQWEAVMGNNPSRAKGSSLPVTGISWNDCQDFIKRLNAKTNGGYRLPTEAEWEYACRAGTTTVYSYGDKITPQDANFLDSRLGGTSVGRYKPNAFGLFDMHGNVWEWSEDWFGDYPTGLVIDPKGPVTGKTRVLRGGSFAFNESLARSSMRGLSGPPALRVSNYGFRLARTADFKVSVGLPVPKSDPPEVMLGVGDLLIAPFSEVKAKEKQSALAKRLQREAEEKIDLGKGVKLEMVLIPAGKFMMGSPASEVDRKSDEKQHEVTLSKPFYMGKYEVTQEQWQAVMGSNPSDTRGARLPITDVSWDDCQEFIKRLNAKTNVRSRLPTEAEWEYSCRAGTTTAFYFGDRTLRSDSNYGHAGKRVAVGSYKANAFGLFDMHGNVWEWCADWYGDYSGNAVTDPKGPATGESRNIRGGSFSDFASYARSSLRGLNGSPAIRVRSYGFRLAMTP